ncbi:MAG: alpha/beta hydrolase [Hyphomicrobiales bacterium]|nr:MAG: alpha/beta hydrolase [Hyphomicrobiales bacterium]
MGDGRMDTIGGATLEAPDAAELFRIWPGDGVGPGSEGWTWSERTMQVPWTDKPIRVARNVVVPTLTVFRPAPGTANGTAMIVAPGGAFHFLMVDHEGYDMARWLAARGVTAFVLKYRVAHSTDADEDLVGFRNDLQRRLAESRRSGAESPITDAIWQMAVEDGRQAIRVVRERAAQYGIDPGKIGISGFSAGGAVTMGATLQYDAASRPDFAVGVYPPYRDLPVPADAPPLFLIISDDDSSVSPAAAARLYIAWREAGIPAEFHVFGNGGHGWGMLKDGFLSDGWENLLGNWMRLRGLL